MARVTVMVVLLQYCGSYGESYCDGRIVAILWSLWRELLCWSYCCNIVVVMARVTVMVVLLQYCGRYGASFSALRLIRLFRILKIDLSWSQFIIICLFLYYYVNF